MDEKSTKKAKVADTIGWIGSLLLATCGAPLAWKCIATGRSDTSLLFLAMWLGGEICYVISIPMKAGWVPWLMLNYILNIVFVMIIAYYKLFPSL